MPGAEQKCHPEWWHGSRRSRKVKRPEYGFRSGEHSAFGAEHCNAGRPVFSRNIRGIHSFFFREAVSVLCGTVNFLIQIFDGLL